jgi:Protein of unknown function (DUF1194)
MAGFQRFLQVVTLKVQIRSILFYKIIDSKDDLSFSLFCYSLHPMKKATPLSRGLLSYLPSVFAMSLVAGIGLHGQAHALAVDSELVLLVDVNRAGLSQRQFNTLMDAYAASFSSAEVLNSIQSGTTGRIAVSLMFYGNATIQQVGIPWMSIANATDAATFATLANNLTKPVSAGSSAPAPALAAATQSFGTETGGASNGFESTLQIIDIAAASVPNARNSAAVPAAGDAALAAGVDLINTVALGGPVRSAAIANYYTTNVVGSTVPGVEPSVTASRFNNNLEIIMAAGLSENVGVAVSVVPEPDATLGILTGISLLLGRRRRA